ncbi:MAG: hypothetical protein ACTSPB_24345, partial [Candidatus Thorarchaeota archaeon]
MASNPSEIPSPPDDFGNVDAIRKYIDDLKNADITVETKDVLSSDMPLCAAYPKLRGVSCGEIAELFLEAGRVARGEEEDTDNLPLYRELDHFFTNIDDRLVEHYIRKYNGNRYSAYMRILHNYLAGSMILNMDDLYEAASEINGKLSELLSKKRLNKIQLYLVTSPVGGLFWTGALMRVGVMPKYSLYQNIIRENEEEIFGNVQTIGELSKAIEFFKNNKDEILEAIDELKRVTDNGREFEKYMPSFFEAIRAYDEYKQDIFSRREKINKAVSEVINQCRENKHFSDAIAHALYNIYHKSRDIAKLRFPTRYFESDVLYPIQNAMTRAMSFDRCTINLDVLLDINNLLNIDEEAIRDTIDMLKNEKEEVMWFFEAEIQKPGPITANTTWLSSIPMPVSKGGITAFVDDILESGEQTADAMHNISVRVPKDHSSVAVHIINRIGNYIDRVADEFGEFLEEPIYWKEQISISDKGNMSLEEYIKKWEDENIVKGVIFPWGAPDGTNEELFVGWLMGGSRLIRSPRVEWRYYRISAKTKKRKIRIE